MRDGPPAAKRTASVAAARLPPLRVPRSALGVKVRCPIVHQPPPPLEQVQTFVGGFDLVLDDMSQRRFDDLAPVDRSAPPPSPGTTTGSHEERPRRQQRGARHESEGFAVRGVLSER